MSHVIPPVASNNNAGASTGSAVNRACSTADTVEAWVRPEGSRWMKSDLAYPCPMPLTVGGENPLPPAMIETVLKDARPSLCRVASLSIRESPRAMFRGLFAVFCRAKPPARHTGQSCQSGCPLAVNRSIARAVARTRTPSATMATPRRAIQCRRATSVEPAMQSMIHAPWPAASAAVAGGQHHGEQREEVDRRLGIECVAEKAAGDLAHWRSRHVLRLHSGRSGARTRAQSPDAEIERAMTAARPAAEYTIGPGEAAASRCQKSTPRVAEA